MSTTPSSKQPAAPIYYVMDAGLNQTECSLCGKRIQGPSRYEALPHDHAEKAHTAAFHSQVTP